MKLLITLVVIFISLQSRAQLSDTNAVKPVKGTVAWHEMKKKNQKTAAYLLLSGGTILAVASLNSSLNFNWIQTEEERRKERAAYTRAWIGMGVMVGSIPLFISGRKHKMKARMLLKNESSFLPDPSQRDSFLSFGVVLKF